MNGEQLAVLQREHHGCRAAGCVVAVLLEELAAKSAALARAEQELADKTSDDAAAVGCGVVAAARACTAISRINRAPCIVTDCPSTASTIADHTFYLWDDTDAK